MRKTYTVHVTQYKCKQVNGVGNYHFFVLFFKNMENLENQDSSMIFLLICYKPWNLIFSPWLIHEICQLCPWFTQALFIKRTCLSPKAWNIISQHAFSVFLLISVNKMCTLITLFQDQEVKHEEHARVYFP